MKSIKSLVAISTVLTLAACGGGGGSTSPSNTSNTYPLRSGYQSLIGQSEVNNYSISGTCTGSATETRGAAVAASFEGVAGVSTTTTLTGSYSNCTPASFASTGISYYDTNYKPLGAVTPGADYAVYAVSDLPISVKVGDTAQFGTADVYSSNTKQVKTGTRTLSYAVETDSGSTAIINLIAKGYNTSNQLLYTQQSRYRINTSGQLTAVSKDIQYSTTNTSHMVWTKN
jgi:predicted small lipoprotein YifL